MLAGLVFSGKIRYHVSIDVTTVNAAGTGSTAGATYNVYGRTWNIGIFGALTDGLTIGLEGAKNSPAGTDSYNFTLDIPLLGISATTSGASWKPTVDSVVTIRLDVYETDSGRWYVDFGTVEWDRDGLNTTYAGAGGILGYGITPAFLPVIGTPLAVYTDLGAAPSTTQTECDSYTLTGTAEGVVIGGYEIWDNSDAVPAWESLPIDWGTPDYPTAPDSPPFSLNLAGITRGTTTWDAGLNLYTFSYFVNSRYRATNYINSEGKQKTGWFWVIPNIERSVKRGTLTNYVAMIQRGGLPQVTYLGDAGWGESSTVNARPDSFSHYDSHTGSLYPTETAFLGTVIDTHHVIEDPMDTDAPTLQMVYAISHWESEIHGPGIAGTGTCSDNGINPPAYEPNIGESVAYQSLTTVDEYVSGVLNYLDYDEGALVTLTPTGGVGDFQGKDSIVRYWHYWCHPHWSYWFRAENWSVDGSTTDRWKDYWVKIGSQWLYNAALPTADNRLTRCDQASATGPEGGNSGTGGLIETFISGTDYPSSWWGNWKYVTETLDLPASMQMDDDSSPRWEIKDGGGSTLSATFGGSDVSVTIGTGDVIARIELASFVDPPFMYPSIAQRFEVLRDSATVDRIRVYLEGADGSLVELDETDVQAAGGANWPSSGLTSTKFAGTWAHDYGVAAITDQGADIGGAGESSTVDTDDVRSCVFQLLPGRTAKYLKVVATPKAATDPIKLKYPKFYAPTVAPEVLYLGRQYAALVWKNGPGIVLGTWSFWDYISDVFTATPLVLDPGSKQSVLDALCTKRVLEGVAADSGLDTRIGQLYVVNIEYTIRKHVAYQTVSWPVISDDKCAWCLQNTYTPPPLAWFPPRERDTDYQPLGDRSLECYDWSFEHRHIVSPHTDQLGVYDGGTEWTDTNETVPAGWRCRSHAHTVDNTETGLNVRGRINATDYATVRPWHGEFAVIGIEVPAVTGGVDNHVGIFGQAHKVYEDADGNIQYEGWQGLPSGAADITSTVVAGSSPHVFQDSQLRTFVMYARASNGYYKVSDDDGATWRAETSMITNVINIRRTEKRSDSLVVGFRYDSGTSGPGTLIGVYRGGGDAAYSAEFTLKDDTATNIAATDSPFGLSSGQEGPDRWWLSIVVDGETDSSDWFSSDTGATWKRA